MEGVSKLAQRVPSWVERMLIPTLGSRVRSIVKEELQGFERIVAAKFETVGVKFDAVNARIDSLEKSMIERSEALEGRVNTRFDAVDAKLESLTQQLPMIKEMADLKARLAEVERRTSE